MSLTLEQVRDHPAVPKLRNVTYSLLSLLMQRAEIRYPNFGQQVHNLLKMSGFYLTYAILLYLVRKSVNNINLVTRDDIIEFFEKSEQEIPVLYHELEVVLLEKEIEAHLNNHALDETTDSYILYTRNLRAGLYLLLGTTRKRDVDAPIDKISVEIYKFAPLREGDWMLDVSVRLRLDEDMIFQPLGVLYLDTEHPEEMMAYLRIGSDAIIDVSLISLCSK